MTPEVQKDVRELIRRTQDLQNKALENKITADALAESLPDVAEKYRLSSTHYTDGAKLCADKVSKLIKQ
jgi:hypothetical protein